MSKKIILSILLCCLGIVARAAATDISTCENIVYAKSMKAMAGSTIQLPILMNNKASVPSFQFDLVLPEGINFVKAELSLDRTTATNTNNFNYSVQTDGSYRILAASTSNATFDGNDGEVAIVTLSIDENVADGSYPLKLKGIVISDLDAKGVQSLGEVESTLTVGKPEYSEGYSVKVAPISLEEAGEANAEVFFVVASGQTPVSKIDFDIVFNKEWCDHEMVYNFLKNGSLSSKNYDASDPADNGDGSYHFTLTAKRENYYFGTVESTKIGSFCICQEETSYSIPTGIHQIQITNIVATDEDGNKYYAAPTTTYVKVGEPTESDIALEGHVTKDVTTALANETSLTKIDMSKVVSIDGSLTLRDKCDLIAPKYDVPVSAVTYKRSEVNKWGTICLPYDVTSSTTIQYYKLKEVGESTMTFEPVTTVEAGTPAVFRLLDENETVADMSEINAVLKAGDKTWTGAVDQWEMKGTYTNITIDPTTMANDIYYIATNKILHANQSFKVAAYRGWFETPKSSSSKSKAYSVGFGDDNTTDIDLIENENGEIDLIFDLGGKQLPQTKKGINIINNKKVIVK